MKIRKNDVAGAPPWLWIYFIILVANTLPQTVEWLAYLLPAFQSFVRGDVSTSPWLLGESLGMAGILILFLGVLTVLFPQVRRWWVERDYGLSENLSHVPVIAEIEEFIRPYDSQLVLTATLTRPIVAFVYPAGYRTTRLGIGAGLIKLWRTDRQAAEAVLLHEVAHIRWGDVKIIGAGSLLEFGLRLIVIVALVGFLLVSLLNFGAIFSFVNHSPQGFRATGLSLLLAYLYHFFLVIISSIAQLIQVIANNFLWLGALVLGIWVAEINADYLASHHRGNALLKSLSNPNTKRGWRTVLYLLTHPPDHVRRWFLGLNEKIGTFWLLVFFPLSYIIVYIILTGIYGLFLGVQNWINDIPKEQTSLLLIYAFGAMHQYLFTLLRLYGVLILAWPFASGLWEKIMSGNSNPPRLNLVYIYAASCLFLLITSYVGIYFINLALERQVDRATPAMAVSSEVIPRKLYFPSSDLEIQPFIRVSSGGRASAASLLNDASGQATVLLVFRERQTTPITLQAVQNSLSIGLINEQGEIIEIQELKPGEVISTRQPSSAYRFALLTSQDWFTDQNVKVDDRIEIKGWPPTMACIRFFISESCQ